MQEKCPGVLSVLGAHPALTRPPPFNDAAKIPLIFQALITWNILSILEQQV